MRKQHKIWIIAGLVCLILLLGLLIFAFLGGFREPAAPQGTPTTQGAPATDSGEAQPEETTQTPEQTTQEATEPESTKTTDPKATEPKATDPAPTEPKPTEPKPTEPAPTEPAPTEPAPTESEATEPAPTEPDPSVPLPTEEEGLVFPCQIPGHDLVIERLAPYSGLYVEDGSNEELSDVAMLLIRNTGSQPVEYTQIVITYPSQTLQFYLSALPGGESAVVQERSRLPLPQEKPTNASALVVERTEMAIAPEISVTDNGDNTLTVTNLTDKDIPTVRIFYKYYMEEENLFVGGIAFTVKLNRLGANKSLVVQPAHYTSQNSKIVMVLTYDTVQ